MEYSEPLSLSTVKGYQFEYPLNYLHDLYIENLDIFLRFLLVYPRILNLVDDIQPLNSSPENGMLVIKPGLPRVS